MSYLHNLGRYYVNIRLPFKYQKRLFICCLVNMPHCMFSKTKGLSCDCTHDIDHSGTEAEKGRKQTELMFG